MFYRGGNCKERQKSKKMNRKVIKIHFSIEKFPITLNKCQDICVKNLTFVYLQKNSFNYENS